MQLAPFSRLFRRFRRRLWRGQGQCDIVIVWCGECWVVELNWADISLHIRGVNFHFKICLKGGFSIRTWSEQISYVFIVQLLLSPHNEPLHKILGSCDDKIKLVNKKETTKMAPLTRNVNMLVYMVPCGH